jgi:hypothetical protein
MDLRLLIFLMEIFLVVDLPLAIAGNLKLAKLLLKAMCSIHRPNHLGEDLCQNLLRDKFILNILIQDYGNLERFQVNIVNPNAFVL